MKKYRNKFEERCGEALGESWAYESIKLTYTTQHSYTPDFVDEQNKRIIESKGYLSPNDRSKMLAVKAQHPDWTFTIQFQNPNKKISRTSNTTYKVWAERHGFEVLAPPNGGKA